MPGSSVGLLLPPDATPSQRQQFEQTLASMTVLLDQTRPTAPPLEQEPSAPPMELEPEDTHVSVRGGSCLKLLIFIDIYLQFCNIQQYEKLFTHLLVFIYLQLPFFLTDKYQATKMTFICLSSSD